MVCGIFSCLRMNESQSKYGSLVLATSNASGMNGGRPPVDQKVPGVGNVRPNANWVSVTSKKLAR